MGADYQVDYAVKLYRKPQKDTVFETSVFNDYDPNKDLEFLSRKVNKEVRDAFDEIEKENKEITLALKNRQTMVEQQGDRTGMFKQRTKYVLFYYKELRGSLSGYEDYRIFRFLMLNRRIYPHVTSVQFIKMVEDEHKTVIAHVKERIDKDF